MEVKLPRSVNTVLGKNSSAYWRQMLFAAFLLGFGLYFTSGELGAMESSNSLALAALFKNKRNLFLPVFSSAFVFFSLVYCLVKNDDEKEPDRQERTSKRARYTMLLIANAVFLALLITNNGLPPLAVFIKSLVK